MKKLIITLSIIAMLGVIFPGLPILAQPGQLPHENPDTTTDSLDVAGLLLSYSDIINLAIDSQYRSAQDILSELESADLPDEIRYIIDQYSYLFEQLFTSLDNIESLLDKASDLLAHNQIGEIEPLLDHALAEIDDDYTLLEDVEVATNILTDRLGVFTVSATSQLTRAHTRQEVNLERLNDLVSRLNSLNQTLEERYVQKTRLIPTELSLNIDPAAAYVGDFITASGRLSSNDNPIAGRKLSLYLDSDMVANAFSGSDGTYIIRMMLPYIYKDNVTFTTVYEPSGSDTSTYLAGNSPPVTITTKFYPTLLEVSTHKNLYRGLPFTVRGEVNSNDDRILRNVMVFLDDYKLAEQMASGEFSFEIMPPEKTPPGPGELTVAVSPLDRYSGAAVQQNVTISILPVSFNVQTPSIVLLPGDIHISGNVYNQLGPVKNVPVNCNYRKSSTTVKTSADGSFTASLKAPLDLLLVGPQEISIDVIPLESWSTTSATTRQVFTINPLNTSLALVILIALWLVIRRRNRMRTYTAEQIPPTEMAEIPFTIPLRAPRPKLTGIKEQVFSAYRGVIAAIEKITGVIMSPDITLREFLKMAQLPSPAASDRFTELTSITETTLYSAYIPRKDTATRARRLAANIKEELLSGTS